LAGERKLAAAHVGQTVSVRIQSTSQAPRRASASGPTALAEALAYCEL